jgi:hypothetical protein
MDSVAVRLERGERFPGDLAVKAPSDLNAPGRALWEDVSAGVAEGWKLDAKDYAYLTQAAKAADMAARLQRRIDREGVVVKGSMGQRVAHPLLREARLHRALVVAAVGKVELAPPRQTTGHLNRRQRAQLADARRERWPPADG